MQRQPVIAVSTSVKTPPSTTITSSTQTVIFTAKSSTGAGTAVNTAGANVVIFQITAAVNSTLTYKFQFSNSDTQPDFSSARTETNVWEYGAVWDLNDSALIKGDDGVAITNDTVANNIHSYLLNVPVARWVNVEVYAYTDGDLTASALLANI